MELEARELEDRRLSKDAHNRGPYRMLTALWALFALFRSATHVALQQTNNNQDQRN